MQTTQTRSSGRMRRGPGLWAAVASISLISAIGPAHGKTTVTTYSYNDDGALTAVTEQVDDDPATTTYLTWDNFTPDGDDPTTGSVSAGDGRLAGFGTTPGDLTTSFAFDPRDRLVSANAGAGAESYEYHANGMVMTSSIDDDSLSFYYNTATHPTVTNLRQDSTGQTSGYLESMSYLDDGSEHVLLTPRKDVSAVYDPASETVQSYVLDAFGSGEAALNASYDLQENPFIYSGEYRTPVWGGYFLRARWYHPDLPSFLTRDPEPKLNRYAYGSGNPVMNVDPSGFSSSFFSGLEHFLRRLDNKLNSGVGGHFARIFLAPLMGPLQIAAYPQQFWHAIKTDQGGIDVFLALGVASEVAGGIADSYLAGYAVSLGRRFAARAASDITIGVGGSIAAGANHGFSHFNWNNFVQGLELTGGVVLDRGINGTNVRSSFQLEGKDVVSLLQKELSDAPPSTALVFRQKTYLGTTTLQKGLGDLHSPIQEGLGLGWYHERLVAVTKDEILQNDAIDQGIRVSSTELEDFKAVQTLLGRSKGKFEFVGKVEDLGPGTTNRARFLGNPKNLEVFKNDTLIANNELRVKTYKANRYSSFTNNCQHHAYAVLKDMGFR